MGAEIHAEIDELGLAGGLGAAPSAGAALGVRGGAPPSTRSSSSTSRTCEDAARGVKEGGVKAGGCLTRADGGVSGEAGRGVKADGV